MKTENTEKVVDDRKTYEKPQIKHELPLEIRTGSPVTDFFDPLNPLGLGK